MKPPMMRFLGAGLLLIAPLTVGAGSPSTHPVGGDVIVADFDGNVPQGVSGVNATLEVVTDEGSPAAGAGCLKMTPTTKVGEKAYLKLPLPEGADAARCAELLAQFRTVGAVGGVDLRWYALNAERKVTFQRRFNLGKATAWTEVRCPLDLWRWADDRIGDWSEVRWLVLVVESRAGEIWLDEIRLTPGRRGELSALLEGDWLKQIAFAGRKSFVVVDDGMLVGTDAVGKFSPDDLKVLTDRMKRIRAWIGRLFGDAVRPVAKGSPVALLVFAENKEYLAFYRRLGEAWNAEIIPPDSGGYTVQDIAASTYSAQYGIDRPVYLHEAVHAIAARDLRLRNGTPRHSWLQEGLANYLQICVYPKSLDRRTYVMNFAKPIDPKGKGFFKPLKTALTGPVEGENYAQLAGVVAFLVAERPEWLGKIARGLADGETLEKVLKDCGTSTDELEKAWFAWGAKTFAPDAKPPGEQETIFPLPQEWRGHPATTSMGR